MNAERAEKDRLKQDIELLSTELERARQLHLSTYKELQSAESTMSQMVYPEETNTVVRTPKQVLERGESTPSGGETMSVVAAARKRGRTLTAASITGR